MPFRPARIRVKHCSCKSGASRVSSAYQCINPDGGQGWNITFLSAPTVDKSLVLAPHPGIDVERISERPTYVVTKLAYFEYCRRAIGLALRLQPKLVYASDPIGALPGLLASRAGGSDHLIYHEHDTPNRSSDLNPIIRLARTTAIRTAKQVIFPHAERAAIVGQDLN